MRRSLVTLVAAAAATGTMLAGGITQAAAGDRPAAAAHRTPLTATLQADADATLTYGMPGVLVHLDAPDGAVRVRSGYGDVVARTPVPWNAKFRIGSFTKTFVAATVLQLV